MSRSRLVLLAAAVLALLALLPAPAVASPSGVVISEFRFRGPAGASDEFVELVNAGASPVDVSGWRVQACSATTGAAATRATVPDGTTLAPGRHLLVANSGGYSGAVAADLSYATGIADGGGVRLVTGDGAYVDGVASVVAPTSQCREGAGLTLPTTDSDTSFDRLGGTQDTDDNATDFAAAPSDPQNRAGVAPALSVDDIVAGETGEAIFTVTLSRTSARAVTVGVASVDGTATAPADYAAVATTIEIAPGELTATVAVPIAGDELDEPDETFSVALAAATRATIADAAAEATIVDDDAEPSAAIADISVGEGGAAELVIALSAPSALPISVRYATSDGSATAPADYQATAGTVVLEPGTVLTTVVVPTAPDELDEPDETFTFALTGSAHAEIADALAEVTIVDDDEPPAGGPGDSTPGSLFAAGHLDGVGVLLAWVRLADGDPAPRGRIVFRGRRTRLVSTELHALVVAPGRAIVSGVAAVGAALQPFELRLEGRHATLAWGGQAVSGRLRGALRIRPT